MKREQYDGDLLLRKAKRYAHLAYRLTKHFPKDELFGITSQLKRASLSIPLNIVEGYARQSTKTQIQFLKIAYGSTKESLLILEFARDETYITNQDHYQAIALGNEIGKMLWSKIHTLSRPSNP